MSGSQRQPSALSNISFVRPHFAYQSHTQNPAEPYIRRQANNDKSFKIYIVLLKFTPQQAARVLQVNELNTHCNFSGMPEITNRA